MNRRAVAAILILVLIGTAILLMWQPWKTQWGEYNRWGKKQPFDFAFFQKLMENRHLTDFTLIDGPQEKQREKLLEADALVYQYFNRRKIPLINEMLDSGKTIIIITKQPYLQNLTKIDSVRYHELFEKYNESKNIEVEEEFENEEVFFEQEILKNNSLTRTTWTSEEKVKLKHKNGEEVKIQMPYAARPYYLGGVQ